MKQTKKHSKGLRLLSAVLALVMVLSLLPLTVFAEERTQDSPEEIATNSASSEFIRIFHLDCGRKYFSVAEIEGIIDQLAENHFTHIQLAFGNNGFRFLLDNMSVTANGTTYSSEKVTSAITSGNDTYSSTNNTASTMLSQDDMDTIIAYAKKKNISVIPMLNTPGHMDALVSAMQTLGIRSSTGSEMSITSESELAFIKALQQKYITYFADNGSERYNFAADEYSFSGLTNTQYTAFAQYVNDLAAMVKEAKMIPMAYNDGINYSGKTTTVPFDTDIQICYWSQATNYASVTDLAKDFKIINNNDAWYYVLGDYLYGIWAKGQWGYEDAKKGLQNTPVTQAKNADDKAINLIGSVLCCWCDGPAKSWSDSKEKVYDLIKTMAEANPDYFKAAPVVGIDVDKENVYVGDTVTLSVSNGAEATWTVAPEGILTLTETNGASVTATATAAGTATVTATVDGVAYTKEIKVNEIAISTATEVLVLNGSVELTINSGASAVWTTSDDSVIQLQSPQNDESGNVIGNSVIARAVGVGAATVKAVIDGKEYTIELTVTNRTLTQKEVRVAVGATKTVTIDGVNYAGEEYTLANPNIATVDSVTGQNEGTETKDTYTEVSVSYSTLANSKTNWTKTDYYYEVNGDYKPVYAYYSQSNWYYYYGYYASGNYVTLGSVSYWNRNNEVTVLKKTTTTVTVPTSTTITIKGVAEGTTTLMIGDYLYTIYVDAEDLSNAAVLPIQLWITNVAIEVTGVTTKGSGQFNDYNNGGYAQYVSVEAEDAYGEKGVLLSDLVPQAVNGKTATVIDDREATYTIWKGTVLNTTTGLQKYWWKDMTKADGRVDYQYVRYYGGAWAVSSDRVNWTTVTGEGSTGSSSSCKEQVIAYYMQRTDVTTEVITDVVDWGNATDKWNSENPTQYGVLDFAVQYPDGTRVPDTFPETGKTVYFHCNESDTTGVVFQDEDDNYYRRIGLIKATDTTGYEVYMITVTPTSDTATDQLTNSSTALSTSITIEYNGTERVAWIDNEANLPARFQSDDMKFHSISGEYNYTVGGNANLEGLEIYQRQGMLVTYYLRPRTTPDTLKVHYIDKVADKEFHSYEINVKNVEGETPTLFDPNIGLDNPWKGPLKNGTVKNDLDVIQTVTADLGKMPQIGAQYRFANYECVEVRRSDDGKDVYLYYTFKSDVTFVVDFGIPLKIAPASISENLAKANITGVSIDNKSYYADITTSGYDLIYTLKNTIDGEDNIQVRYTGTNLETQKDGYATFTVRIIPAANVYYEDSFAHFEGGAGAAAAAKWSTVGTEKTDVYQALEELGGKTNVYGYDAAYDNCTMFSMGSAHTVNVTSAMAANWNSYADSAWPTATFTFKGTGFDVISLTNNTSGAIFVDVVKTATGTAVKNLLVDNYYGYKQEGNTWVVDPTASDTLYQIPVMKVTGLHYDEYTVTIKVAYSSYFDHTANKTNYNFWLDAIRVYDPMGENAEYTKDGEGYPQYIKLRDAIAKDGTAEVKTALFIDGAENADITTYANYGPNNEVYLAKGQAITFNVQGENIASVQIGAKAPKGAASMVVNQGTAQTINTATEMYYTISNVGGQFTITNTGEGILSLTNLKITFTQNSTASLAALTTQEQNDAVMAVRALFTVAPEPFEPSRFEASWNRTTVRAGQKATLIVKTSEDVDAITVNGQTITTFRVRTERTGWGWWSSKVTYREFTYSVTPTETTDYAVAAVNAEGVASEPQTFRLTVSNRGFGGWLKDLFRF